MGSWTSHSEQRRSLAGARRRGALVASLLACSLSLPVPTLAKSSRVEMPHYSFEKPAERGWRVQRKIKQMETTVLTKRVKPFTFQIKVMVVPILDESRQSWTAAKVADDYRAIEERMMIEQGVERGLYELRDLTKGETVVGDKTFYTMDYVIDDRKGLQQASLCLLFPRPEDNEHFILLHYSETIPALSMLLRSYRGEFEAVLASLTATE